MSTPIKARTRRIEIPGDVLVVDEDFCRQALAGASKRTAKRLEEEGLPYVMVAGWKFRPLNAGLAWLAGRITRRNQPQKRRSA
jgi:hypothetical protein